MTMLFACLVFTGARRKFKIGFGAHWSKTPAPLILVEADGKFLTHHPPPPTDFIESAEEEVSSRRTA